MLKIAVFVSGGGTNLQALIDAQNNGTLTSGRIVQVISSRSDAYALERAKKAGIPCTVCDSEAETLGVLKDCGAELGVLAGYMKILSPDFLRECAIPIMNVHPSLIPSFCGKGYYGLKVHEAVLKAGVKVTGATVHMVNEIPDGGEIVAQKAVEVLPPAASCDGECRVGDTSARRRSSEPQTLSQSLRTFYALSGQRHNHRLYSVGKTYVRVFHHGQKFREQSKSVRAFRR